MILQREKKIPVWGTGEDGEEIQVTFRGVTEKAAVKDGVWFVELPPCEACIQETLRIDCAQKTITFRDVAVGEVWLAAGQSNMEFYMFFDEDYEKEKLHCENSLIRFFDFPKLAYDRQEEDFDYSEMGFWRSCSSDDLKYYSAVAYYAAVKLHKELNVPIGIIGCNWGGTTLSCWMKREDLSRHGQVWLEEYQNSLAEISDMESYKTEYRKNPVNGKGRPFEDFFNLTMMRPVPREQQLEMMKQIPDMDDVFKLGPYSPNRPSGLYEHMVSKTAPYGIRGIMWYQGESDVPHPELYQDLFKDLVKCWRRLWREDLPFFTVQLAPFEAWLAETGERFPMIRKAQENVSGQLKEIYLISTSDSGMQYDIHPKKKQPVGKRIALSMLSHIYGRSDILGDAPRAAEVSIREGIFQIRFKNAGEGLYMEPGSLPLVVRNAFGDVTVRNLRAEGEFLYGELEHWDTDNQSSSGYEILFAQTPYYKVNLYNSSHIPALPFYYMG